MLDWIKTQDSTISNTTDLSHLIEYSDTVSTMSNEWDEHIEHLADDDEQTSEHTARTGQSVINIGTSSLSNADAVKQEFKKRRRRYWPILQKGPPYICDHCGHSSPTRALLTSHRHRKHRPIVLQHFCPKCNKGFEHANKLEKHLRRPTCDTYPEFQCEYCDKKCVGLSNYNIHLRFHKKLYPYVCHVCAKRFMMATHLTTHVKTKHEFQRFICEYPDCGKMFQTSHSLKTHAYTHADVLPYKCEYCLRMYPTKGRLRWHINRSHGIEHTLEELDSMLVAEKIDIKAELKPILGIDYDEHLT